MKTLSRAAILAGMLCLLASPVLANMTAVLTGTHSSFPVGGGGWFNVQRTGDLAEWNDAGITSDFHTFCVEDVYFYPGTTYTVSIDPVVMAHGPADLQLLTKRVYAWYSTKPTSLLGMDTIGDDAAKNTAMQALIWDLQGTIDGSKPWDGTGAGGYVYTNWLTGAGNAAARGYYADYYAFVADPRNGLAAEQAVGALNLWINANGTGDAQSQLILGPLTTVNVPVPAAIVLGSLGLGLVGWTKRRMAK